MTGPEPQIHMPPPSLSPAIIGVGVTFIAFGVLYGLFLVAIGLVFLLLGLGTWLVDDARAYTHASDEGGHGHGAAH